VKICYDAMKMTVKCKAEEMQEDKAINHQKSESSSFIAVHAYVQQGVLLLVSRPLKAVLVPSIVTLSLKRFKYQQYFVRELLEVR
jgi:hypothetical protein